MSDWELVDESKSKPTDSDWEIYHEDAEPEKNEATGFSGILSDMLDRASEAPGNLAATVAALPGEGLESGKQIATNPLRAGENLIAGRLSGLKGMYNAPANLQIYLLKKMGIEPQFLPNIKIGDTGLQQAVLGEEQPGDPLLQLAGAFGPYGKLGGMERGLKGTAKRAGAASAYAIGQNQDPITAALMGILGEGAIKGVGKVGQGIKNLRTPSSPLSIPELEEAQRIHAETETPLGQVIQNPELNRQYENAAKYTPFSGANSVAQRIGNQITEKGENFLKEMRGKNPPEDTGEHFAKALRESHNEARNEKEALYKKANDISEKLGIETPRTNVRRFAQEKLDEINSDEHLKVLANPELMKLLNSLTKESNKNYSIKNTNLLRAKYGEKAYDAASSSSPNTELASTYGGLKKAAEKDINEAVETSGNNEAKEALAAAHKNYKENYAPFKDTEIQKYLTSKGDTDLLVQSFLKTSNINDRSKLLTKLSAKLDPDQLKTLTYEYFSRAIDDKGKLNPLQFRTLFKKLGEKQKKALFGSEDEINALRDFSTLIEKNEGPLNIMLNPKTGITGLTENLVKSASGLVGGLATAGTAGAGLSTLGGALIPTVIGKLAVRHMTKPAIREKVIKRIIKKKMKDEMKSFPDREQSYMSPFVQALLQSGQNGQE